MYGRGLGPLGGNGIKKVRILSSAFFQDFLIFLLRMIKENIGRYICFQWNLPSSV